MYTNIHYYSRILHLQRFSKPITLTSRSLTHARGSVKHALMQVGKLYLYTIYIFTLVCEYHIKELLACYIFYINIYYVYILTILILYT